jgi:hypothetical protein
MQAREVVNAVAGSRRKGALERHPSAMEGILSKTPKFDQSTTFNQKPCEKESVQCHT